ncbi:MAG: hypothetical protein OIN88_11445 [Candidatus Methanoperedens sp.]|nr:hypothetical protein [Candidatus Methanoperedens sp.]MCZ7360467.1 hypothetical protein [Candidatus Methanoperedens sp.]HLB69592.1 hypothetical protein [Candidatus Methanoperedens sp.]
MNVPRLPTLRLLSSSAAVAISGALRLHIAFLFSGIEPKIMVYLAGGLIIYATYTLDRTFSSNEDEINRKEHQEVIDDAVPAASCMHRWCIFDEHHKNRAGDHILQPDCRDDLHFL